MEEEESREEGEEEEIETHARSMGRTRRRKVLEGIIWLLVACSFWFVVGFGFWFWFCFVFLRLLGVLSCVCVVVLGLCPRCVRSAVVVGIHVALAFSVVVLLRPQVFDFVWIALLLFLLKAPVT